jgi:hypothetical protein
MLDHNLSARTARALNTLYGPAHEITPLRDKFPTDTDDIDWIRALHDEGGWAVLTKDLRIRTKPHERAEMDKSNIVFFFLDGAWKKYGVEETTARLIRLFQNMDTHVGSNERGRINLPVNAGSQLKPHRD